MHHTSRKETTDCSFVLLILSCQIEEKQSEKMGGHGEGVSLEFTPTWVVAGVCTIIVAISLAVERLLHHFGTVLKKKKQKPLFEALQKVKEGK